MYEPDGASALTKPRSKAAVIKEASGYEVARESSPDPGQYDGHLKEFGHDERQMTLGGKWVWKPNDGPAPGQYETEGAVVAVKPRGKSAIIREDSGFKVPREIEPAPGQYDGHLKEFGASLNNVTFGAKHKFVPDSNPAAGQYEIESAAGLTKPRA